MADATPVLERIARAMRVARLEGVLIGNAGAAIQGGARDHGRLRFPYERAARQMELDLIRERLSLAPEECMGFLRVRLPNGGSTL